MIGLIVPANLKFCPYVSYYTDLFKENNIPYEIISWDKANIDENVEHSFKFHIKDEHTLLRIIGYFRYARFIKKVCKKKDYKGLIVYTIAPAIAISTLLAKKFKGRYYLDIRDDTILRKLMKKKTAQVIQNACGITTSSNEYNSWIGRETTLNHNVDVKLIETLNTDTIVRNTTTNAFPIRIMFAGGMREDIINTELIDKLKNNDKFSLIYHTPETDATKKMIAFCKNNSINNVSFHGTYKKEEIYSMYKQQADWCNIIRCNSLVNRNALPNKLYDPMIAGVPIIVLSHNKAVCDYVRKFNLGIIFDSIDDLEKNFIERASTFDYNAFEKGRIDFLEEVRSDTIIFNKKILEWVNSL